MKEITINKIEAYKTELNEGIKTSIINFEKNTHTIVYRVKIERIDVSTHNETKSLFTVDTEVHVR